MSARGPTAGRSFWKPNEEKEIQDFFRFLVYSLFLLVSLWQQAERSQFVLRFGSFRFSRRQGIPNLIIYLKFGPSNLAQGDGRLP